MRTKTPAEIRKIAAFMQMSGKVTFPVSTKTAAANKILLDSGALHASYVSTRWYNKHKDLLNEKQTIPVEGVVYLGDSRTEMKIDKLVVLDLHVLSSNNKYELCRTAYAVIDMEYDFIVGLPDLCTKLDQLFLKQFRLASRFVASLHPLAHSAERPLTMQAHLAQSKAIPAPKHPSLSRKVTNAYYSRVAKSRAFRPQPCRCQLLSTMDGQPIDDSDSDHTDNEFSDDEDLRFPWKQKALIAPEELQTEEETPILFKEALNFMEQTVEEADLAYSEQLRFNDAKYNELNNNERFKQLMNGKARRVYTPHNWDGINLPDLHLNFHESLPDHHTVKARTIPYTMQDSVSKELTRLRHYHLLDSQSPYASALVVAAKATAPFVRMCGDYRWINQYILIQHEWIPNVLQTLQKLQGFKYYIDIDLTNAFHQIRIDQSTSEKLSILTPDGLFRPKFLPEGVAPASAILQRYMKQIFKDFANHTLVVFDNVVIGANSLEELLDRYEAVLDKCIEYNVILKLSKSTFALRAVNFFGYVVDKDGWHFDINRLQGLNEYSFPSPSLGTDSDKRTLIQQFLGAANFFRPAYIHAPAPQSLIADRAALWVELTSPLYDMTHHTFDWNPTVCDYPKYKAAFDALKASLLECSKLYFPDYALPWILRTDASTIGLGAVLYQRRTVSTPEGVEEVVCEPIATVSHKFSDPATRWATIKQELYAIYHAVSKLQHLFHGKSFIVETDHANLEYLEASEVAILIRWRLFLQQFNFMVKHIPGKVNLVADAISRQWLKPQSDESTDLSNDIETAQPVASELLGFPEHFIREFNALDGKILTREQEPVSSQQAFKPLDPKAHPPVSKLEESRKHTQHIKEYDDLIKQVHGANSLHFGVDTTWKKLSNLYPGHQIPRHYIDFYISRCPHCQKAYGDQRNNATKAYVRHLVPPTIRTTVGMDMIELQEDQHGYKYAHVIVNQFSKYVFIHPTKTANAQDAAKALLRYIATVGPVRTLRTDPG